MSNTVLVIKSSERSSGSSSSFTVNLPRSFSFRTIKLLFASIPNSIYNVPSSAPQLEFRHSTTGVALNSAGFAPGFYTASTLAIALENGINAIIAPATVTVTYSTLIGRLVITCTAGQTIEIVTAPTFTGFTSPAGPSLSVSGASVVDLSGIGEVYIDLSETQKTISTASRLNFASFVVPIVTPTGDYSDFNVNNNYELVSEMVNLQSVSVIVRDSSGNIVDFNGANITLIFRLCQ